MNMENPEKKPFKTTLHLSGEFLGAEFNLKKILDLLKENGIKVLFIGASNKKPDAHLRISEHKIPIEEATLTIEATEEKVKEVLLNSEFKDNVDALMGHGLN